MRQARVVLTVLLLALGGGADPSTTDRLATGPAAALLPAAARVVDSILPLDEEIRRFTSTWPARTTLTNGAPSREELVERWAAAVETRDSTTLATLLLAPGEFIGLYYPNSPYTGLPYRQSPALVWFRMINTSSRGLTRVMQRHGGEPLHHLGLRCEARPPSMGPLRIWSHCRVRRQVGTLVREQRLFGPIIEQGGRYKFLTYNSEY